MSVGAAKAPQNPRVTLTMTSLKCIVARRLKLATLVEKGRIKLHKGERGNWSIQIEHLVGTAILLGYVSGMKSPYYRVLKSDDTSVSLSTKETLSVDCYWERHGIGHTPVS